jgi:hypothetical protein
VRDAPGHSSADTTRRYDHKRHALDGHAVYAVEQAVEQLA